MSPHYFTEEEKECLYNGEPVTAGNRRYMLCYCGKIVCVNKPLLGSLHVCGEKSGPHYGITDDV